LKIRIGTFNMENLFLRYSVLSGKRAGPPNPKPIPFTDISEFINEYSVLLKKYPPEKIMSDRKIRDAFYKEISKKPSGKRILAKFLVEGGTINNLDIKKIESINDVQRRSTAKAIRGEDGENIFPDILAVQEVENMQTLKEFNRQFLDNHYKYMFLVDGNDRRQIDVGFFSNFPAVRIQTHQYITDPESQRQEPLFSRDCLEVDFAITSEGEEEEEEDIDSNAPILTFFNNHFKSQFVDWRKKGQEIQDQIALDDAKRKRQADRVADIVTNRFKGNDFNNKYFIVCGDFNDDPNRPMLTELLNLGLENVVNRISNDDITKKWTYYYEKENTLHHFDYLLLSPALANSNQSAVPIIERRGVATYGKLKQAPHNFNIERFAGVKSRGTEASDHCPVFIDLDIP
jgi:predicted extracellular nuclease